MERGNYAMIQVTNIKNLRSLTRNPGTAAYAIVRSLTYPVPGATQMDVLSPSRDLFFWYRRMVNAGKWNKRAFDEEYVPRFLKEIKSSPAAKAALEDISRRSRNGETIALACFCADESMCHRSIIAGILAGAGADVKTDSGKDYSFYYDMYRNLA